MHVCAKQVDIFMQTHPLLIERSVGATLCAFQRGQVTPEEAELDLVELISTQISGRTSYATAVIGFYVRANLKSLAAKQIALADVFDTMVDAAAEAAHGHIPATVKLSQSFIGARQ